MRTSKASTAAATETHPSPPPRASGVRRLGPLPNNPHFAHVHLHVDVSLESASQFYAGLNGNPFEGGLFVETYRSLPAGTVLVLEMDLLGAHLTAAGCVQWVRDDSTGAPAGVGVALVDVSASDRAHIEDFCRLRAPLYYEA